MKRRCTSGRGVIEIWRRELGAFRPRAFTRRIGASEDLVLRFDIHKKLDKHTGCVNTVSFNADGGLLVSGSDDMKIILWDWDSGCIRLSFDSGHSNNVFQACFMPYTDDCTIITCAADGQVRQAQVLEGGQVTTAAVAQHDGQAHKLAIEPGSPYVFYSCGEDGLVQHIDLRTKAATKLFTCTADHGEVIQLNTMTLDPRSPNLFAIAGSDEYARVYDIRRYKWDGSTDRSYPTNYYCPHHLIGDKEVGISGLAFSDQSELLASYNDELIYLFSKDQGLGPNPVQISSESSMNSNVDMGSESAPLYSVTDEEHNGPQVYKGHQNCETVKGVSFFGPNCEYVTSGSDCGRIFIWRKKDGKLLRVMEGDKYVVNCIESHPYASVIASSGIEKDIKVWMPKALEPAPPVKLEELSRDERRIYPFTLSYYSVEEIRALQWLGTGEDSDEQQAAADLMGVIMSSNNRHDTSVANDENPPDS